MLNYYPRVLLALLCVPGDAVFQWPSSPAGDRPDPGDAAHPWQATHELTAQHRDGASASSQEEWDDNPSIFWRKRKGFDKGVKEFMIDVGEKEMNIYTGTGPRWQKNKGREDDIILRLPPWYSFVFDEDLEMHSTTTETKPQTNDTELSQSSPTNNNTNNDTSNINISTTRPTPLVPLQRSSMPGSASPVVFEFANHEPLSGEQASDLPPDTQEAAEKMLFDDNFSTTTDSVNADDSERMLFDDEGYTTSITESPPTLRPSATTTQLGKNSQLNFDSSTVFSEQQTVTPETASAEVTTVVDGFDNPSTVTQFTLPPVENEQNGTVDIFKWLFKVARQIIQKSSNKTSNPCSEGNTALHLCTGLTGGQPDQNPMLQHRYSVYKCKNTIFELEEFSLDTDRSLISVYSDEAFREGEYTVLGDSAVVCFPFSKRFLRCNKTFLHLGRVKLEQNGHILWNEKEGQFSTLGNFELYNNTHAVVCQPKICHWCPWFLVTWVISAVCLLLASAIFLAIPQRDQHLMQVLLCHMISQLIFFVGLISMWFKHHPFTLSCRAVAMSIHFGFLSSFFWINIFAFTIWKQFRGLKSLKNMVPFSSKRLILQCMYGWGLPLITVLGFYLLDLKGVPRSPKYERNCLVRLSFHQRAFFYGPIIPVLISNLVFFILVIINLYRMSRDAKMVNSNVHLQLLKLCFKLFIVMGFWWVVEVITWAVGVQNHYLLIPRLINGLQGFYLFVIYVCKDNIRHSLLNHFCQWRKPKLQPKTFYGSCVSVAASNTERNRLSNISINSIT